MEPAKIVELEKENTELRDENKILKLLKCPKLLENYELKLQAKKDKTVIAVLKGKINEMLVDLREKKE